LQTERRPRRLDAVAAISLPARVVAVDRSRAKTRSMGKALLDATAPACLPMWLVDE
jgi:hypothetical protein